MSQKPNIERIAIAGEFSIFNAVELRARLLDALAAADAVEVDLAQVSEIDSAGLQLMIAAKQEAAGRDKTLGFVGHSPAVLEALDLCDLIAYLGDPVLIHSRA